jgi:glycosyltransferase involved in cell wall biosynthesis
MTKPTHKLKVCHFASVHTTTDTRVFHRECTSLAKFFDVTFIGIGNKSGLMNNVNVIAVPKPSNRIYRLLFTTWKVFFLAWKQHADIYHIHDAELIPFAFLFALRGKKVIYDIHENTYEDIMRKPWILDSFRWVLGLLFKTLEWLSAQSMYTILVIAKPEFAKKFITRKRVIIQNFADFEQFNSYRITQRQAIVANNLFYIGTVYDYYYDLIPIIKALHILKQQGKIIHFHCVGYKGRYVDTVLSKLPEYQELKEQLHFYGYLNTTEGYEISKTCKVGLCLKNQPEEILLSHERKFFEYMAAGLPVLACNYHIYKEIIDTHQIGKYVTIDDAKAISAALDELFFTTQKLDMYAANGVDAAELTFNWHAEETKLIDLYNNMANA